MENTREYIKIHGNRTEQLGERVQRRKCLSDAVRCCALCIGHFRARLQRTHTRARTRVCTHAHTKMCLRKSRARVSLALKKNKLGREEDSETSIPFFPRRFRKPVCLRKYRVKTYEYVIFAISIPYIKIVEYFPRNNLTQFN